METILFVNGEPVQQEECAAHSWSYGQALRRPGRSPLTNPLGPGGFAPISARPVLSVAPPRTATVHLISEQIRSAEWFQLMARGSSLAGNSGSGRRARPDRLSRTENAACIVQASSKGRATIGPFRRCAAVQQVDIYLRVRRTKRHSGWIIENDPLPK